MAANFARANDCYKPVGDPLIDRAEAFKTALGYEWIAGGLPVTASEPERLRARLVCEALEELSRAMQEEQKVRGSLDVIARLTKMRREQLQIVLDLVDP
jgi:hypothetical protein